MIPTEHNISISYNERRPIDQEEVIIGGVTQSVIVYSIPYYLAYIHNLKIGAEGIKYNSSGQTGKDIMLNTYNWIITDGGL